MKETPEEYQARKEREYDEYLEREREREDNRSAKQRLISRAESISSTNDFKAGAEEMHELMEEWKSIGSAGRDYNDDLWSDFQRARTRFFDRRTAHREQREREMERSRSAKKSVVSRAQSIARSNDFKAGASEMASLFEEWKNAGFAGKEHEEELWADFSKAREQFYSRRDESRAARAKEYEAKKSAKRSIINRANSIASGSDFRNGHSELESLRQEWKSVGHAGQDAEDQLWSSFQAAQKKYYDKANAEREKKRKSIENSVELKRKLISKANDLLRATSAKDARKPFNDLQQEWKAAGYAGDRDQELWAEFSAIREAIFATSPKNPHENQLQRIEKNVERQFSQRLRSDIDRENRRASSSLTGGFKDFGKPDWKQHKHHSDPKEFGGNPRQNLTSMNANEHRAFHSDNRSFRSTKGWSKDTPRERNIEIVADQYDLARKKYPKAAADFFAQHPDQEKKASDRNSKAVDFVRNFKPSSEKD
jgi:hypothetical protein